MNWKRKLKNDWGLLGLKYKPLSDIANYVIDRIEVDKLTLDNYISTENMISNKGGVGKSAKLPRSKTTASYKKGDVLISNIRPYFKKIWFSKNDGGCSNDILVLRAKEGIHPEYLYYVLSNDSFFEYATATSKGTKMPRGDKQAIMKYRVPDISLDIQIKIADMLSTIDELIYENNKINENLEQQCWNYFYELFINNADSIWPKCTLSDIGSVVSGGTPSKSKLEYYTEKGISWITPKDLSVNKSKFISHGEIDISELGFAKSNAQKLPAGTVLFSSRAPIGYIAIAQNVVTTNQGFKSIIPNKNIGTAYTYYLLKYLLPTIEAMGSGSTFKEISGSVMKSVPTVMPDDSTLKNFTEFCEPIFRKQEILEIQNNYLTTIRNILLPKIMSGELDITKIRF